MTPTSGSQIRCSQAINVSGADIDHRVHQMAKGAMHLRRRLVWRAYEKGSPVPISIGCTGRSNGRHAAVKQGWEAQASTQGVEGRAALQA